ncbi:hypothetical protein QUV83_07385 [Cellulomonas cellasea]|uniref:hypothetical protein n=1 Tax=Cellulomonas cellasea TaxID=43670 RepID=UPI0025A34EDA|nr:hypothetical protein [Cellulomonas cellasea]MDM8084579.1 hypothetical protein [Cellulomonas cellasea]
MSDIEVDLSQLRAKIDRLLAELIRQHGTGLDISFDYFWEIQDLRLTDVFQEAPEVTIGQVSEALEFLDVDLERWEGGTESLLGAPLRWLSNVLASVAAELEYGGSSASTRQ